MGCYNGDGLLYERAEGEQLTRYYYDEQAKLMAEATVTSGITELTYAYIYDLYGQLWARQDKQTGKLEYYQLNGHGDIVGLVDDTGKVLNSYTYDIWGGPITTEETVPNVLRYAGEYWDETVGLQYLRARWYDPGMARFIGEDTYEGELNDPLSLNLYSYVHNNPLKYVDPSGHRKTGTYYEVEFMINAAMKGDNSFKSDLSKVFRKVYNDKGNRFNYLYPLLTQTSVYKNSDGIASWAKAQLLSSLEKGQDSFDYKVGLASTAGGMATGRISNSLGFTTNVTKLLGKMPEFTGSNREKLMSAVRNAELKKIVNELYRPGAKFGDGGTAAALIQEFYDGSSKHLPKAKQRLKQLNDLAKSGKLGLNDLDIVDALRDDLGKAIKLFQ